MKIEQWILDEVIKFNPCSIKYKAGQDLSDVSFKDLLWLENKCPELIEKLNLPYLVCFYSKEGFSYGEEPASGYSYRSGFGYGDGYANSFSDGDGYGDGYGNGYGCTSGSGEGEGGGEGRGKNSRLILIKMQFLNGEIK